MMTFITSFPPIADPSAHILILGSMPGEKSLQTNEYYAHPQNAFWKIMGELIGAGRDLPYAKRLEILKANHIAVWDVLQECVRPGSLDSAISQEIANDFVTFLQRHPQINHIFFNGTKAEQSFQKFAAQNLPRAMQFTRLPSTSPAHASAKFADKLEQWRKILTVRQ